MVAKLGIVEEAAADESIYWLELLVDSNLAPPEQVTPLAKEADEIVAMTVASIKTLRNRKQSGVDHLVIQNLKSKIMTRFHRDCAQPIIE